jgi:replicative DNA helicase
MPYDQCFNRTISCLSNIELYGIRDATLSPEELQSLYNACGFVESYPYKFEIVDIPRGVTVEQIEERYLEALSRYNPDVVVVDYLGLLEDSEASGDDWLKLGYIAGKLHELSRVYGCAMLTAVQLNRLAKNSENRIGLHRFGRSSLIATHATLCLQIETRPDEHQFSDMPVHIIKNRNGSLGHFSLRRDFSRSSLQDYEEIFLPAGKEPKTLMPSEVSDISKLLTEYKWI